MLESAKLGCRSTPAGILPAYSGLVKTKPVVRDKRHLFLAEGEEEVVQP